MKLWRGIGVAALAASLVAMTACGTTETDSPDSGAAEGGPVSVVDDLGNTVELDAPAQRVVVTEWQETSNVLALGVQPVGVSDPTGYGTWDADNELDEAATDVGTRGQEDSGAVVALDPDLVIVTSSNTQLADALAREGIATYVSPTPSVDDPLGGLRKNLTDIATLLGKDEQGAQVLQEFDDKIASAREALADLPEDQRQYVYFDAYATGATVKFRPFGPGSLVGALGAEIGLENVWAGAVDDSWGLGESDLEGLTTVGDVWMFYTGTESNDWTQPLDGNPIWQNLPANQSGKLRGFPAGIWTFGGPVPAGQIVDAFVSTITA